MHIYHFYPILVTTYIFEVNPTLWQGLGRGAEVGGAPLQHRPPAVQPPRPPLHPLQGAQPQELKPTPGPLKSCAKNFLL